MVFGVTPRPVRYSRARAPSGDLQLRFKVLRRRLVQVEQLAAQAGLRGFFGRGELALGQRDPALLRDGAHGFGKADVFDLHHKGEDIALHAAAEAV